MPARAVARARALSIRGGPCPCVGTLEQPWFGSAGFAAHAEPCWPAGCCVCQVPPPSGCSHPPQDFSVFFERLPAAQQDAQVLILEGLLRERHAAAQVARHVRRKVDPQQLRPGSMLV